jgi:hypothetical protein
MKVRDCRTGIFLADCIVHQGAVLLLPLSDSISRFASGGCDNTVRILDGRSGNRIAECIRHKHCVASVCFPQNGRWIASGSFDQTAKSRTRQPAHSSVARLRLGISPGLFRSSRSGSSPRRCGLAGACNRADCCLTRRNLAISRRAGSCNQHRRADLLQAAFWTVPDFCKTLFEQVSIRLCLGTRQVDPGVSRERAKRSVLRWLLGCNWFRPGEHLSALEAGCIQFHRATHICAAAAPLLQLALTARPWCGFVLRFREWRRIDSQLLQECCKLTGLDRCYSFHVHDQSILESLLAKVCVVMVVPARLAVCFLPSMQQLMKKGEQEFGRRVIDVFGIQGDLVTETKSIATGAITPQQLDPRRVYLNCRDRNRQGEPVDESFAKSVENRDNLMKLPIRCIGHVVFQCQIDNLPSAI